MLGTILYITPDFQVIYQALFSGRTRGPGYEVRLTHALDVRDQNTIQDKTLAGIYLLAVYEEINEQNKADWRILF